MSDGTDSPAELVVKAAEAGLDVVALTDHDTTAGWAQAMAAAPDGLRVLPGAELSTSAPSGATVHLLAYLFDPDSPGLAGEQTRLRAARRERLRRIVDQMAADGFPVDEHAVFGGLAPDAPAGRPHLAAALVAAGVVATVGEAFDRFLRVGGPYYVQWLNTPVAQAVRMVSLAGGVTVLAHPLAERGEPPLGDAEIAELAAAGLGGIEVDHPLHDVTATARLRRLAAELGLVATGGSDYHGANKPVPLGARTTSPQALRELLARAGDTGHSDATHPGRIA